jgi:hypothetical protein
MALGKAHFQELCSECHGWRLFSRYASLSREPNGPRNHQQRAASLDAAGQSHVVFDREPDFLRFSEDPSGSVIAKGQDEWSQP